MGTAPAEPSSKAPVPPAARAGATKRTEALSPAQSEICVHALREIRVGLSQALLYMPGTVQFGRVCDSVFASLTQALDSIGDLKVGVIKGQVLINGERLETPANLRGQLDYIEKTAAAAGTASIKFRKGLTSTELSPFLQMLARKQLPHGDGAKVNQFLREQGIEHAEVDDLRYVALTGEERVVSGEGTVLSNNAAAHKAVTDLVDATLTAIAKLDDAEARTQLRAEVADQFIEKSQEMLPTLLATAAQRLKHAVTDEQAALSAAPPRDGKLLTGVLEAAARLPATGAEEAREMLSGLIEQIARPYEGRAEDLLAHAKLEAARDLAPGWLLAAQASLQGTNAVERLSGILRQSPATLLSEQIFPQIVDILDEFSVAGMDAESGQLAEHVAKAMRLPTKRERMKAVERLSFLLERLMEQSSTAVRTIEDALLEACTHETSDEVLKLLVEHLGRRCTHHYKLGNWARALEHIEWLASLEESRRLALGDEGAGIVRETREALAKSAFAQTLAADLLTEGEQGAAVIRISQILGATAWGAVVERLRSESDASQGQRMAARLREIGPDAARLFMNALGRETDGHVVLRLLVLAPAMQDEAGRWTALQTFLRHGDAAVRESALALVIAQNDEAAAKALAAALHEEGDAEQRTAWILALARLSDPAAGTALADELDRAASTQPLDEASLLLLLETLSAAGHRSVIATALKLLQKHGQSGALGAGAAPRRVLLAAIKALAPFYRDPEAAEELERLHKDRDPEIARLALVCLRGIVAAQQHVSQAALQVVTLAAPQTESVAAGTPRPRRGFEILEASAQMASQFVTGAAIGGAAKPEARGREGTSGAQPQPGTGVASPAKEQDAEPSLAGLKPTLEGQLGDLGLAATVRMVGSKDGVLTVSGPPGEGRVYIKGRRVVRASYAEAGGVAALTAIKAAKGLSFAYFPMAVTVQPEMDVEAGRA